MPTIPGNVTVLDLANLAGVLWAPTAKANSIANAVTLAADLYREADAYMTAPAPLAKKEEPPPEVAP
jgi:hypothetical protein